MIVTDGLRPARRRCQSHRQQASLVALCPLVSRARFTPRSTQSCNGTTLTVRRVKYGLEVDERVSQVPVHAIGLAVSLKAVEAFVDEIARFGGALIRVLFAAVYLFAINRKLKLIAVNAVAIAWASSGKLARTKAIRMAYCTT